MVLQLRGLNVQNALFPTDIQDYSQNKHWLFLLFIWLLYYVKIEFKEFPSVGHIVGRYFYASLHTSYMDNVHEKLYS